MCQSLKSSRSMSGVLFVAWVLQPALWRLRDWWRPSMALNT